MLDYFMVSNLSSKLKLSQYKKLNNFQFKETAVSFLVKNNQVLLGMKKCGFGQGQWNGIECKKKQFESVLQTAIRGTYEKIFVKSVTIRHCATIYYYYPDHPEHNQKTSVYIINKWLGKPVETQDVNPRWFNKFKIPHESMNPTDSLWLPKLLNDENFIAEFLFDKSNQFTDYKITDNVK